jgi:hypothetical protein
MATPVVNGLVRAKRPTIGGPLQHGPRVQWQQNTNQQQQVAQAPGKQLGATPLPSAPPSANPEAVDDESAAGTLQANLDSSAVQNKVDQRALQNGPVETKVERSKPSVATAARVSQPMAAFSVSPPAKAQLTGQSAQPNALTDASIRWTISAAGGLQRSLDQGTTWQDINVDTPSATGGMGAVLMKPSARAKEVSTDDLSKKDAAAPLTFRAVASNGPDVWAGASGGFLYHSTDAGSHWTRVVPSASGVSLSGDIVSLEFVDPQHGRVVTSIPEVWTTSDAGQSWQKQ